MYRYRRRSVVADVQLAKLRRRGHLSVPPLLHVREQTERELARQTADHPFAQTDSQEDHTEEEVSVAD